MRVRVRSLEAERINFVLENADLPWVMAVVMLRMLTRLQTSECVAKDIDS